MNLICCSTLSRLLSFMGFPSVIWCNAYWSHTSVTALRQCVQTLSIAKLHCFNVTRQYKLCPMCCFTRGSDKTMCFHLNHMTSSSTDVLWLYSSSSFVTVGVFIACFSNYEQWNYITSLFPNWGGDAICYPCAFSNDFPLEQNEQKWIY